MDCNFIDWGQIACADKLAYYSPIGLLVLMTMMLVVGIFFGYQYFKNKATLKKK